MPTVTIQIGNSDDRLAQCGWHDYVEEIRALLEAGPAQVHFFGAPPNWTPWQNAAWVVEVDPRDLPSLRENLAAIRARSGQESLAWTVGETEFI